MTKRDMRTKTNKQHLKTAANRNEYEQKKSVTLDSNKPKEQKDGSNK